MNLTTTSNSMYYSSEWGRWISRDPIEEEGGWNLYAMAGNNTIILNDFIGLDFIEAPVVMTDKGTNPHADATMPIVNMSVFCDETCDKPNCYRLKYVSVDMTVTIYIPANRPISYGHESTHLSDFKSIAYDKTVAYAKSIEGCYTEEKANHLKDSAMIASHMYYYEAALTTIILRDLTRSLTDEQRKYYIEQERFERVYWLIFRRLFIKLRDRYDLIH